MGLLRVELKTDSRNRRSREAIERLGATKEVTLRQHVQTHQGLRDTVYFSILDSEWFSVKRKLKKEIGSSVSVICTVHANAGARRSCDGRLAKHAVLSEVRGRDDSRNLSHLQEPRKILRVFAIVLLLFDFRANSLLADCRVSHQDAC